jgi:hypothetical protein
MTTTIRPVRTTVLTGFYETNTIGYYARIFCTKEAQENQDVDFCAKLVIFAQADRQRWQKLGHAVGVHDTSTVTYRGRTRHTDALCATIQASAWRA